MYQALSVRPRDATVQALLSAGVPRSPALRAAEALESEWLWRTTWRRWTHPRLEDDDERARTADFSRTPAGFHYPTPDLGEHSTAAHRTGVNRARSPATTATGAIFGKAGHVAAPGQVRPNRRQRRTLRVVRALEAAGEAFYTAWMIGKTEPRGRGDALHRSLGEDVPATSPGRWVPGRYSSCGAGRLGLLRQPTEQPDRPLSPTATPSPIAASTGEIKGGQHHVCFRVPISWRPATTCRKPPCWVPASLASAPTACR